MSNTRFFFSVSLFGATSSIPVMRMLTEEAERSIANSISNAQVEEGEYTEEHKDEQGEPYLRTREVYSCGPCADYDASEASERYKHLITQLTRRAAFLTIFGIFEYNMAACTKLMVEQSGYDSEKLPRGVVEAAEEALKKAIGCKKAPDLKPLSLVRNLLAHNDGKYYEYNAVKNKPDTERSKKERRQFLAFEQAIKEYSGLYINDFHSIVMDDMFLTQAVDTIEIFAKMLFDEVNHYVHQKIEITTI